MSYAVVARIKVKPEFKEALLEKLSVHARLSQEEPGCMLFNVAQTNDDPLEFFFFEVYKDQAAFNEHIGYERVQSHIQSVRPWLEEGSWSKKLTTIG